MLKKNNTDWTVGQRWLSETEPELGLGLVSRVEHRHVRIRFDCVNEERLYRKENAPLLRFRLAVGEEAADDGGTAGRVDSLREENGLVYYRASGRELCETDLSVRPVTHGKGLFARLQGGDPLMFRAFRLRLTGLQLRARLCASATWGLNGPRAGLVPHQLYIAEQACRGRKLPRLMLCDEVGLGKTIEAGYIWHQLQLKNRLTRTLVLVPDPLKHQWLVELYRRFHQMFTVMDAQAWKAARRSEPTLNPFNESACILCSADFLWENQAAMENLLGCSWDLLIVDEAHHLTHENGHASREYRLVRHLSEKSSGILMLTGTPLQLHPESHFHRLQLLEPDRFTDFSAWQKQRAAWLELAQFMRPLLESAEPLTWDCVQRHCRDHALLRDHMPDPALCAPAEWLRFLAGVLGSGEQVYRNRRVAVGGFPVRHLHRQVCPGTAGAGMQRDPRFLYLIDFLKNNPGEKLLCICAAKELVLKIQAALQKTIRVDVCLFHEDEPLVARDRAAAWFADPDGASLLLASEIGSEGRNFQFAHHLLLFDLPRDPGLLDQRIGRLDRIGQRSEIHIHVPCPEYSEMHALALVYHEGLNAFLEPVSGADDVLLRFLPELLRIIEKPQQKWDHFTQAVLPAIQAEARALRKELEAGRDRLLEFHSFDQSRAEALRQQVQTIDRQNELERFLLDVLDAWGVDTAEAALSRSWVAHPGLHMRLDSFPGIPDEGLTFTFDRTQGLEREDIVFMSWEHPLALGAIDVVTGDQDARICAVQWKNGPAPGVFVHFVFLLEAEIPATWGLEGVAPAVPLDVFVDAAGSDCSSLLPLLADAQVKALPRPGLLKKQIAWCENEGETIARGLCADRATAERATWERAYRKYRAREMLQTKLRERMGLAADNEDSFAADVSQRLASAQLRLDAVAVLVSDNRSVLNGEE